MTLCSCVQPSRPHHQSGTGGKLNSGLLWGLDRCCSGMWGRTSSLLFVLPFSSHELNAAQMITQHLMTYPGNFLINHRWDEDKNHRSMKVLLGSGSLFNMLSSPFSLAISRRHCDRVLISKWENDGDSSSCRNKIDNTVLKNKAAN